MCNLVLGSVERGREICVASIVGVVPDLDGKMMGTVYYFSVFSKLVILFSFPYFKEIINKNSFYLRK